MKTLLFALLAGAVSFGLLTPQASADSLFAGAASFDGCAASGISTSAPSTAGFVLASLEHKATTTPAPYSAPLAGVIPATPTTPGAAPIQVAGRCGSSQYRCDSPGFLYCCGNSTDGFYCAADVNGCTK
jgi:hypothetical protein